MIPVTRDKTGVQYTVISPAGHRLLAAIDNAAVQLGFDLTITSACDGSHSGENDPHHSGEAYDVRSQGIADKEAVLLAVLNQFGHPTPANGGYVTAYFFGWLEDAGTANEHFHFQRRKGISYPPQAVETLDVQE